MVCGALLRRWAELQHTLVNATALQGTWQLQRHVAGMLHYITLRAPLTQEWEPHSGAAGKLVGGIAIRQRTCCMLELAYWRLATDWPLFKLQDITGHTDS
jgi:hypothetical protein